MSDLHNRPHDLDRAIAVLQADLDTDEAGLAAHIADATAAHAASAISVSSSTLAGTGTDVQAVFEELDNSVVALESATSGLVLCRRISFTETAGAGTYTGTVAIAAGGVIHSVGWETTAVWDSGPTILDLGYTGALEAYGSDIDVDAVGGDLVFGLDTEDPDDFAAGTTFTAKLVTTGAGGTTGRTMVTVTYSVPPAATAATKA